MTETYPKTIHKLPTEVSGHAVLAWAACENRPGNYPGGYVLACNPGAVQPYVVWTVYTRDGGETWNATGGQYRYLYTRALEDFIEKARGNDIARAPLTEPAGSDTCPACEDTTAKDAREHMRIAAADILDHDAQGPELADAALRLASAFRDLDTGTV
jgi:hypothetical protein